MDRNVTDAELEVLVRLGETLITMILQDEPNSSIREQIKNGAPLWYQDELEGISALHAAVYMQNEGLVKYLLAEGAVWNAVDHRNHTAGDIALSYNNDKIYTLIRDHGIRSEMLLGLLSSKSRPETSANTLILNNLDQTAANSTDSYLQSKLAFVNDEQGQEICVVKVGDEEIGVMMGWEREIMEKTVEVLCEGHPNLSGLRILNIGHGLGIIDSLFQGLSVSPAIHCIVEPHPDVLQFMKDRGWYNKPGVKVLEGTWQTQIDELVGMGGFDVVYTDTFSEDYKDLQDFFEHLPDLLSGPESRFGFFNGLGATNFLFYDVYTHLSELHLAEIGLDVEWHDVHVNDESKDRWGKTRQYFSAPIYRLPVGSLRNLS
ncbi:arginine methyl transferase [Marasmius fiardii PR-910]|nr:arginine methyl transferase [Marasmius fiardii PR-910]